MPEMYNSCSDFPLDIDIKCRNISHSSIWDDIYKEVVNKHESVIIQVLADILKREPNEDDFKKCTRVYLPGEHMNYTLTYENIKLGYVKFIFEGVRINMTFTPDATYRNS